MDCMKKLNANYTKREFKMDALLTDFEFDSIKTSRLSWICLPSLISRDTKISDSTMGLIKRIKVRKSVPVQITNRYIDSRNLYIETETMRIIVLF